MKTILLFALVALTLGACTKTQDTVTPQNLADAVAGQYTLSYFRYTVNGKDQINQSLPVTQNGKTLSGAVVLKTTGPNEVSLDLALRLTGSQDSTLGIDGLTVKQTKDGYSLSADNIVVGAITPTGAFLFNIEETSSTGDREVINFDAKR